MEILKKSKILNLFIIISMFFSTTFVYSTNDLKVLPKKNSYNKIVIVSTLALATIGVVTALVLWNKKVNEYVSRYASSFFVKPIELVKPVKEVLPIKSNKNWILLSIIATAGVLISLFCGKKVESSNNDANNYCNNVSTKVNELEEDEDLRKPIFGYSSLHTAVLNNDMDALGRMILYGANIEKLDFKGRTPLYLACKRKKYDVINYLIRIGADPHKIYKNKGSPLSILIFDCGIKALTRSEREGISASEYTKYQKDYLRKYLPFNSFSFMSIDTKSVDYLFKLICDEKTAQYDKQDLFLSIFKRYKESKIPISVIDKSIKQILFNTRFFNEKKFREILDYAMKNNLTDSDGNTILVAAINFSKDRNFVSNLTFKFLIEAYDKYSYSSDKEEKRYLKNESEIILKNAKRTNRKIYFGMRNIDVIWKDFKTKNIAKVMNKERFEAGIVKNIVEFIGVAGIKSNKIYFM